MIPVSSPLRLLSPFSSSAILDSSKSTHTVYAISELQIVWMNGLVPREIQSFRLQPIDARSSSP